MSKLKIFKTRRQMKYVLLKHNLTVGKTISEQFEFLEN